MEIDIKALLNEYEISFRERGKNVSKGWINLEVCPFCTDSSFHCGINLQNAGFHCWVCDEKGSIWKILKEMEEFKGKNLQTVIHPFLLDESYSQPEDYNGVKGGFSKDSADIFNRIDFISDELFLPHRNYLIGRGFDPDLLIKRYKLKSVYNAGFYKFRIIVPVFFKGESVAWVAASVLDRELCKEKGIIPYLNCPPEDAITPVNHCLYNIDSVKDKAVIVEGITDVWNCGEGFVASFRKGMTPEQISVLVDKKPKQVFVMYDPDAIKQGNELADQLSPLFPYVEVLELEEEKKDKKDGGEIKDRDPGNLSKLEVIELRRQIFSE